ncbi:uncharacterized protein LOC104906311 [Beta vulgaris subsp. vulgaris]|uniref:uncharacterized protein LOC104906311 n=1 Tax=Beta vulgaris subsp. vulgaris TaxID=3555 RepID=UPI00203738F9|nr:uncharacterized protein LOC104906311 [Beta vulgaris subsp. vulgaris]
MAGQWVTTQEVIDELNRVKAEMATLKESYVASCMENQSLKSAQKSKGSKRRNIDDAVIEHDAVIEYDADIEQRLQRLEDMIARIPGVPRPMEKATPDSYADSPFADFIAMVEVPKRFSVPTMKMYDGTTDPNDHVAQYKQLMMTISIPRSMREACMCKGFGSTLTGPALQWFIHLGNGTISSFAQLINIFNLQFASSRKMEKQASDLHRVVQKYDESLKEFVRRFNKEKVSIPNCDVKTAIEAFRRGLDEDSDLYKELTKYPCPTFEDAQAKASAQIRLEEDMQSRKEFYDVNSRKSTPNEESSWRPKPYDRPQQVHSVRQTHQANDWKNDPNWTSPKK